jgi:multidrug efflux pump subunit AcrA (membrane-fusion protein)
VGQQADVIKLPASAVRQDGAGSGVWVLDEASMTVDLKPVQVGAVDGNQLVISAGLQAGQKVVSAGVHVLTPGQKVTVYRDPAAAAAPPTPTGR